MNITVRNDDILYIDNLKKEVDAWLQNYFTGKGTYNKKLYDAMYYSIGAGGKRVRPLLMLLTYDIYKNDCRNIIPAACAIEMIHTYSLIHDDLPCMDNDDLRRGKPTNHKVFGENIAVLAGDALLNEAMNIMFDFCCHGNVKGALEACGTISEAAGAEGMVGGQVVDVLSENTEIEEEKLLYMHKKKTGAIIKASVIAGAIMGEASEKDLCSLHKYGDNLGLAFQIKDDILDVTGDISKLGKKTHSDENNNKTTFITLYGLERCNDMCSELTKSCMDLLDSICKDTSKLKELTHYLLVREN